MSPLASADAGLWSMLRRATLFGGMRVFGFRFYDFHEKEMTAAMFFFFTAFCCVELRGFIQGAGDHIFRVLGGGLRQADDAVIAGTVGTVIDGDRQSTTLPPSRTVRPTSTNPSRFIVISAPCHLCLFWTHPSCRRHRIRHHRHSPPCGCGFY